MQKPRSNACLKWLPARIVTGLWRSTECPSQVLVAIMCTRVMRAAHGLLVRQGLCVGRASCQEQSSLEVMKSTLCEMATPSRCLSRIGFSSDNAMGFEILLYTLVGPHVAPGCIPSNG